MNEAQICKAYYNVYSVTRTVEKPLWSLAIISFWSTETKFM